MIQSYVLGTSDLPFRSFCYFKVAGRENEWHTLQVYILKFEVLEKKIFIYHNEFRLSLVIVKFDSELNIFKVI